jgi:hypothetical protein
MPSEVQELRIAEKSELELYAFRLAISHKEEISEILDFSRFYSYSAEMKVQSSQGQD